MTALTIARETLPNKHPTRGGKRGGHSRVDRAHRSCSRDPSFAEARDAGDTHRDSSHNSVQVRPTGKLRENHLSRPSCSPINPRLLVRREERKRLILKLSELACFMRQKRNTRVRMSGHATHLHIEKRTLSNPHPYYLFERVKEKNHVNTEQRTSAPCKPDRGRSR